MKFEELYERAIIMWPNEIDISDGVQVSEEGYLFEKLSKIWDSVEVEAKLLGEWYDLITWIIFKDFHRLAVLNFQNQILIAEKSQIDLERVKQGLLENLHGDDYKNDMLLEFFKNN